LVIYASLQEKKYILKRVYFNKKESYEIRKSGFIALFFLVDVNAESKAEPAAGKIVYQ
jgi:hypothetical protein